MTEIFGKDAMKKPRIPKQFLGAFKAGHRPTAREFIDDEFSFQLLEKVLQGNDEARQMLEYITRFNNEYYKAVFTKTKADLMPSHSERKDRYGAQNARQRDLFVNTRIVRLETLEAMISESKDAPSRTDDDDRFHWIIHPGDIGSHSGEESLVDLLDIKKEMEKTNKQ